MSTRKYENLTGAARAKASRDPIELAALGLLVPVGAGRGKRYYLKIEDWPPAKPSSPADSTVTDRPKS